MEAIAAVCHYIHLNPVRAGIVQAADLHRYRDSSFYQLWYPRKRWSFAESDLYLDAAGGLKDRPAGRKLYRAYLEWLYQEDSERKRLGFEKMSSGWAKETKATKAHGCLSDQKSRMLIRFLGLPLPSTLLNIFQNPGLTDMFNISG